MSNYLKKLKDITTFIFDVDGVMTDSSLYLINGELCRKMSIRDGYALKAAVNNGYLVVAITGGKLVDVEKRLKDLGMQHVYLNCQNKIEAYEEMIHNYDLKSEEVMYMGDDWPDYEVMKKVGLPCCPADAVTEIKEIAKYISPKTGGQGCVRDIIEQVMKVQGKW